jgi:hypothetical protein
MRKAVPIGMLLLLWTGAAMAQPADCPPVPNSGGGTLPLALDLAGRPGVPRGQGGQVYVNVPYAAPGTMDCVGPGPPPPADVLGGQPGNVLAGPPSPNLLLGPGRPVVEVDPR